MIYRSVRALTVENPGRLNNNLVINTPNLWYFKLTLARESVLISPLPTLGKEAPLKAQTASLKAESKYREGRSRQVTRFCMFGLKARVSRKVDLRMHTSAMSTIPDKAQIQGAALVKVISEALI